MQVRFVINPKTGRTKVSTEGNLMGDGDFMGEYFNAFDAGGALGEEFQHRIDIADRAAVIFVRSRHDPCISHEWEYVMGDESGDTYECAKCDGLGFLLSPELATSAR
jgi:hypothetical protein